MDQKDFDILAFQRSYGIPAPHFVFPAIITGRAIPQNLIRPNIASVTIDESAPCDEPTLPVPTNDCDTVETPIGFNGQYPIYADQYLPCGVQPVRYRWQSVHDPGLNSEGCGGRVLEAGGLDRWRQANYAINVSHYYQRPELDYPMLTPGALVHIAFGDVSMITGGVPEYGFYFTLMTDPPGAKECPSGGVVNQPITGCCELLVVATGQRIQLPGCLTPDECAENANPGFVEAIWLGWGVDCDPPSIPCPGPEDLQTVCCIIDFGPGFVDYSCITRQECEAFIGGGGTVTIQDDPEFPCPDEPCLPAGTQEERPGRPRSSGGFLSVTTNYKVGTCLD